MNEKILIGIGIIIVAVSLVFGYFNGGFEPIEPTRTCNVDSDCVPEQCCHPSSCVNKNYAPDCMDSVCTMSCSGPIDCGAGQCGCINGMCGVISND